MQTILNDRLKKTLVQREEIHNYLNGLYGSADIAGYRYVKDIIYFEVISEKKKKQKIKEYYERIAKMYEVSVWSVELAIRYYINNIFTQGNLEKIEDVFGSEVWNNGGSVGNKKFIGIISSKVKIEVEKRMIEFQEDRKLLDMEIYLREEMENEINSKLCKCRECNNEKCSRRKMMIKL